MRIAKNNKILCFILVLVLAVIGIAFTTFKTSYAAEVSSTDYFVITSDGGATSSTTKLDGTNLVLTMGNNSTAEFKRSLIVSDYETSLQVASSITKLTYTFTYDTADVNGVIVKDGEKDKLEKKVKAELVLTKDANGYKFTFGGKSEAVTLSGADFVTAKVSFSFDGERVTAGINGVKIIADKLTPKSFGGNVVASVSIKTECEKSATPELKIAYIDQKSTDLKNEYRQTFALTEGKVTLAKSMVLANESFYTVDASGVITKKYAEKISISFTEYSVEKSMNSSSSFDIAVTDAFKDDIVFINSSSKYVTFVTNGKTASFNVVIADKVYATISVKAVDDKNAPTYDVLSNRSSFKKALYDATREEYEVIDETTGKTKMEEHYVRLGSSNYLDIPSMKSFVSDDTTSYDNLRYTVYYRNNNSDWTSTSSFRIPLNSVGKYEFYVLFTDKANNAMKKDEFVDEDDKIVESNKDLIFSFEVYNDAPISITAASQEKAYKGIEFSVVDFTILAKDYDVQYDLYYSKTNSTDDKDWTKIKPMSEIKESDEDYKEFSEYKYNGTLTFTPAKIGYYKIVAGLFEKESNRSDEATVSIEVNSTPKVVKPSTNWAKNNVWSIVFLSIGVAALVGIIVILCIPEKKDEDFSTSKK